MQGLRKGVLYIMQSEALKRAKKKYNEKVKTQTIQFYPTEQDLIDHLNKQPQKQTYIKNLIRQDMNKAE
jgi:hypothetical protein